VLRYSDADIGDDIDIRKSITGMMFFLGSCPMTHRDDNNISRCMVATIACIAKDQATHNLLFKDIQLIDYSPQQESYFYDRSEHITMRFYFIRVCIRDRKMDIEHARDNGQIADIFMKSLSCNRFSECKVGVIKFGRNFSRVKYAQGM
jgi:hypothetical protein